ncbi:ATP-dependent Clp protease adapter ClpS [Asaia lannensis]|uniref:ATP-dependent Clp protease adapter protein ClpS n=1 Tax=Asaia lannensis NBRC 102526 TaxID=1307926 RepID=A0ABT1CEM8_9PROT|nr:ATP-dependent Clp protease adapter ClpS [Asaia lannensis]MCO6159308.1 ATP-dependent Clp protease adapter ClpS [Asaia lannensis NBRC 102526]GBQ97498.1 Clp protease adaptor protein ClpS [Asaia lannensis NBRC 102526]
MLAIMQYRDAVSDPLPLPGLRGRTHVTPYSANADDPPRKEGGNDDSHISVVIQARPETRRPAMYKVLMLNDDYTPMEFVVHVLERFFSKSREEATNIMLNVHKKGVGVCGVFTFEVAESKVTQVMDLARQNQHPLQCMIEKA